MHRIQPVEWKEIFILLNEFTVTDTFGFNITHAHLLVFLVFRVRAFEIEHFAVAFECENVGAYTVEEPTVVRNHNSTSGKVFKTLLESA